MQYIANGQNFVASSAAAVGGVLQKAVVTALKNQGLVQLIVMKKTKRKNIVV
jgi:hypothetical protein